MPICLDIHSSNISDFQFNYAVEIFVMQPRQSIKLTIFRIGQGTWNHSLYRRVGSLKDHTLTFDIHEQDFVNTYYVAHTSQHWQIGSQPGSSCHTYL